MLRSISSDRIRPRIIDGGITFTDGTPSLNIGGVASSLTDNGAGDVTVTYRDSFGRGGVTFVHSSNHINDCSWGNVASSTALATRISSCRQDGTKVDQPYDFLTVGFDSFNTDYLPDSHSSVLYHRPLSRLVAYRIKGTDTAAIQSSTKHGTLTDHDTGEYTVTFTNEFGEQPRVFATAISSSAIVLSRDTCDNTHVKLTAFDQAPAAADTDFYLWVLGCDTSDSSTGHRRAIKTPHAGARLLVFQITVTAGTPALTYGSGSGTVTDNGTGDFILTFTKPFKRAPEILATTDSTRIATVAEAASTTAVNVLTFTDAGVAQDPTIVNVLVLGYDNSAEF